MSTQNENSKIETSACYALPPKVIKCQVYQPPEVVICAMSGPAEGEQSEKPQAVGCQIYHPPQKDSNESS